MLEAGREALAFAAGRGRADLDRNRMLVLALVKCLEIIGEAAAKVGDDTRALCPALPWADIVGMRNRLIHAYFDVDLDRVWDTLREDLPPLVGELEKIPTSDDGLSPASPRG